MHKGTCSLPTPLTGQRFASDRPFARTGVCKHVKELCGLASARSLVSLVAPKSYAFATPESGSLHKSRCSEGALHSSRQGRFVVRLRVRQGVRSLGWLISWGSPSPQDHP